MHTLVGTFLLDDTTNGEGTTDTIGHNAPSLVATNTANVVLPLEEATLLLLGLGAAVKGLS